nr:submandibular gland secretory Glx-rich protein CB-like [Procambarus clarkii]
MDRRVNNTELPRRSKSAALQDKLEEIVKQHPHQDQHHLASGEAATGAHRRQQQGSTGGSNRGPPEAATGAHRRQQQGPTGGSSRGPPEAATGAHRRQQKGPTRGSNRGPPEAAEGAHQRQQQGPTRGSNRGPPEAATGAHRRQQQGPTRSSQPNKKQSHRHVCECTSPVNDYHALVNIKSFYIVEEYYLLISTCDVSRVIISRYQGATPLAIIPQYGTEMINMAWHRKRT